VSRNAANLPHAISTTGCENATAFAASRSHVPSMSSGMNAALGLRCSQSSASADLLGPEAKCRVLLGDVHRHGADVRDHSYLRAQRVVHGWGGSPT
jgi:hypothetical protein